jgi:fucose permease
MTERMADDRRRVAGVVVVGLSFVVLGLPDFAHGVAWPTMRADLHRPLADLGTFLAVQTAGYLLVATLTGRLTARWGLDRLIAGAAASCTVGLAVVAVAPAWPVVLLGSLLLGLGSGGMDTGFNAAVALRNDGRLMGVLHAGYGMGAAAGPVIVGGSLAAGGGWRVAYGVLAALTVVVLLTLAGRTLGEPPPDAHAPVGSPRGVVLPCVTFFLYVAFEVTTGVWAYTYLTEHRHLPDLVASVWVAAYWVGLTAGRLWLGWRGHRHDVTRLLTACMVGAIAAATFVWVGGPLAPLGLLVAGLSLSIVFPLLMLVTPARVGPERAAAAVGWQAAAGSVGSAAGPALAGIVLDRAGIDAYGPLLLAMAALLAGAVTVLRRPLA